MKIERAGIIMNSAMTKLRGRPLPPPAAIGDIGSPRED